MFLEKIPIICLTLFNRKKVFKFQSNKPHLCLSLKLIVYIQHYLLCKSRMVFLDGYHSSLYFLFVFLVILREKKCLQSKGIDSIYKEIEINPIYL